MEEYFLVTNNDQVCNLVENYYFVNSSFRDVLLKVRDLIQGSGYRVITHPLPPSSRMFLSPVRSVLLEKYDGCMSSNEVIENSITLYDQAVKNRDLDDAHYEDYQLLDFELMKNTLVELDTYNDETYKTVPFGMNI